MLGNQVGDYMKDMDAIDEEMERAAAAYGTIINGTCSQATLSLSTAILDDDLQVIVLVMETREGHPNHPMITPLAILMTNDDLDERLRPVMPHDPEDMPRVNAVMGPHRDDSDGFLGYAIGERQITYEDAVEVVDRIRQGLAMEDVTIPDEDFEAGIRKILESLRGGDE